MPERSRYERERLNELSRQVIGAAIEVHREMGPGLLERTYHRCLARELDEQGIDFQSELKIPLRYKGEELGSSYRLDILVQGDIVVEVKAQAELSTVNDAQLLTYMELTGARLGLLINFHTPKLVDGVRRKIR